MLVESCVGDHDTLDGLVNGVNWAFKDFTFFFSSHSYEYIFINPKLETKQKFKKLRIYQQFPIINKE
jgi:hypothetical protein